MPADLRRRMQDTTMIPAARLKAWPVFKVLLWVAASLVLVQDFTGALAVLSDLGEPAQPFTVLKGNPKDRTWVDVEFLCEMKIEQQSR